MEGFLIPELTAQSAHWFDWNKAWPEIARVLKPGGTASIWVSSPSKVATSAHRDCSGIRRGCRSEVPLPQTVYIRLPWGA